MAAEFSLTILAICFASLALVVAARKRRYPLPPGPKGLPFLGSVFEVPKKYEWLAYQEWSRQHGTPLAMLPDTVRSDICL